MNITISQGQRSQISSEAFADLKGRIPAAVFDGIGAFLSQDVPRDLRAWSKRIESMRAEMAASERLLAGIAPVGGYKPGKSVPFVQSKPRPLRDVVRAAKRPIWCRLLYELASSLKPKAALELGTCVGISGAYILAGMNGSGTLHTLEGAVEFSQVAEDTMRQLGVADNARFVRGLFDDTLPPLLAQELRWDFVFIDGHHDGDATLRYFEKIRPHLADTGVVLFDDVRWSPDMTRAWENIMAAKGIPLCIDLGEVGLCAIFPSKEEWRMTASTRNVRT